MKGLFKIGDIVTLYKPEILKWCGGKLPKWYTSEHFKIIEHDNYRNILTLDKNLPNINDIDKANKIHETFVEKSIKMNRREKLNNIKWK
jgi:hypothetical protein